VVVVFAGLRSVGRDLVRPDFRHRSGDTIARTAPSHANVSWPRRARPRGNDSRLPSPVRRCSEPRALSAGSGALPKTAADDPSRTPGVSYGGYQATPALIRKGREFVMLGEGTMSPASGRDMRAGSGPNQIGEDNNAWLVVGPSFANDGRAGELTDEPNFAGGRANAVGFDGLQVRCQVFPDSEISAKLWPRRGDSASLARDRSVCNI
jgi:hypothetical protein